MYRQNVHSVQTTFLRVNRPCASLHVPGPVWSDHFRDQSARDKRGEQTSVKTDLFSIEIMWSLWLLETLSYNKSWKLWVKVRMLRLLLPLLAVLVTITQGILNFLILSNYNQQLAQGLENYLKNSKQTRNLFIRNSIHPT